MTSSGATSSRLRAAPILGAPGPVTLIQVTWDQSPDFEPFRSFVSAYTKGRFSASLAERLTLASTELLDNAVRYGSLARDLSYRLELEERQVSVCVHNTTVRTRIDMLTTQLRRLETTPEAVYASEMERSMTAGGRRSMLGLARIRHEAEMQIEVTINDNDVTVRARCAR